MEKEKEKEKHVCCHCGKTFSHRGTWKRHLNVHRPPGYKCRICPRMFREKTKLKQHLRFVHNESMNAADQVSSLPELEKKEKPNNVCGSCHKPFPSKSHLKRHIQSKHTDHPDWDPNYKKPFYSPNPLDEFQKTKFMCDICESGFSCLSKLERHQLIHKRQIINCPLCDRQFTFKWKLKRHLGMHATQAKNKETLASKWEEFVEQEEKRKALEKPHRVLQFGDQRMIVLNHHMSSMESPSVSS